MGCRRLRRTPAAALAFALGAGVLASGPPARADRNDLQLLNLCDAPAGGTCPWITQSPTGTTVSLDTAARTRFRSLMSELGVAIAPHLQTPADTLGFAGFQFSAELDFTEISHDKAFWRGVEDPRLRPVDPWLTTLGVYVRKGMWFPIPSLEWGGGVVNVLQSGMWAIQGYVKLALQEGFHDWALPSLAVRGGFSQLVGTDQVTLTVSSIDVVVSKRFSLAGTARIEPFAGWDFLFIDARSGVIDGTPNCDAVAVHQTDPTDPRAVGMLPAACQSQAGTWGDLGASFTFPRQDVITRNRVYGGAKIKLSKLFLVAQAALALAGGSRDTRSATNQARDESGSQKSFSFSTGFDF
jgi:hypothetical protein